MTAMTEAAVRARGLTTRLVGRRRLMALAGSRDLHALTMSLVEAVPDIARLLTTEHPDAVVIERAVRRLAGARMQTLARWTAGRDRRAYAVLVDDEDRRSLRAIVRGALAAAAAETRLAGTIPTPTLPERALATLAQQPTLAQIAALLRAWGHPYAAAVSAEAERPTPDPYSLQAAIDRTCAERARAAVRGTVGPLRRYVRLRIDVENAATALTVASGSLEHPSAELFVQGGRTLDAETFGRAMRAEGGEAALAVIAAAAVGTPLARLLPPASRWWSAEDAALCGMLRMYRTIARLRPVEVADVILFVLRLRAETRDLSRIVWGIALGVPAERVNAELATC